MSSRHPHVWRILCLASILAPIEFWPLVEATTTHSGRLRTLQGSILDPDELFYAPGRFLKAADNFRNATVAQKNETTKPNLPISEKKQL